MGDADRGGTRKASCRRKPDTSIITEKQIPLANVTSEKRNTPNWTQSILRVHHIVYQSSPTNRSPFAIYEHLNGFGVRRA